MKKNVYLAITFALSAIFYTVLLSAASMHDVGWAVTALM